MYRKLLMQHVLRMFLVRAVNLRTGKDGSEMVTVYNNRMPSSNTINIRYKVEFIIFFLIVLGSIEIFDLIQ